MDLVSSRYQQTSVQCQVVNAFGFVSRPVSVTTTQLCHCSVNTVIDDTQMNECGYVPIKLYFHTQGRWVVQLVKPLTLGFVSGHDLTVQEFRPHIGLYTGNAEPAWDFLSLPLSAPPPLTLRLALFLSQNKSINFIKKNFIFKNRWWAGFS